MNRQKIRMMICVVLFILALQAASAVEFSGRSYTSTISSNPGISRPSFENYYSGSGTMLGFDTFYPRIEGNNTCVGRQDLMLRIPTAGCQPSVVRSDLLAEQNVPVFCQIEAIKINPIVDITRIRGIHFDAKKPQDVLDVGFHPSQVALNSREKLLGSPIDRNIGYVVVVLKKNEVEKNLPEFINLNLTARISYDTANTIGVGRAEFILNPVSDEEWEREEKSKQSFWNGRYFLRLLEAESDFADIAIYQGDRIVAQTRVVKGRPSGEVYLPGSYCRAGLQIEYAGFSGAENKARVELGEPGGGSDVFDVYKGTNFLNGKCTVRGVDINSTLNAGSVSIDCSNKRIVLKLGLNFPQFNGKKPIFNSTINITSIAFEDTAYGVNQDGKLLKYNGSWIEVQGYIYGRGKTDEKGRDLDSLKDGLIAYHNTLFKSPNKVQKPDYEIGESTKAVDDAIAGYERIVEEYPDTLTGENSSVYYGEQALKEAAQLALDSSRSDEAARLINKLIEKYPNSNNLENYKKELDKIALINIENASDVIYIDGKYRTLRLISISTPQKKSSATFVTGNDIQTAEEGEIGELTFGNEKVGEFILDKVETNKITLTPRCKVAQTGRAGSQQGYGYREQGKVTLNLDDEKSVSICGTNVKLNKVDVEKVAMIRLNPISRGPETVANLSVNIGIEKRLIKLNPEKSLEKIENLNKTIAKWENIANNLGKVVKGLKATCFASAGILTVKNFISGLSGEGLARQKVMRGDNGWTTKCSQMVERGEKGYSTINDCYLGESDNINRDVTAYKDAINEVNKNIKANEKVYRGEGFLGDKTVNRDSSAAEYRQHLIDRYGDKKVTANGKEVTVSELLKNKNGYQDSEYSYDQLREMELNLILREKGSAGVSNNSQQELQSIFERIKDNQDLNEKLKKSSGTNARLPMDLNADKQKEQAGNVIPINRVNEKLAEALKSGANGDNINDVVFMEVKPGTRTPRNAQGDESGGGEPLEPGTYVAGVGMNSQGNYVIRSIVKVNESESPTKTLNSNEVNNFANTFSLGAITPRSGMTYNNKYLNPKVRYYDNEPYKGMPALVPFDISRGWYAATRQTLPAFGGTSQGAFESSGRVVNFWLCNVGKNGREQFNEGMGDDICEQFNSYSGQSYSFSGINDPKEVKALVEKAKRALEEAANQYGNKQVVINGFNVSDVTSAANVPSVQCQDFMNPKDCYVLFNVCDPVICPASRCNLGGQYQVADVIQSGIIGSTLLCLPNIREKIIIPLCLTGIHAGIESYVSILKSYRDCLRESIDTGKVVGICDQITSIYLCEFFWRQAAPAANVILPKLIDSIYRGKTARGGGEYLTVQGAWNNMQNSIDYFKNTYAVNSLKAFQIRSVEEAGTPFCKAFISAKAPKKFKSLIEPDSPPQFNAWFSSIKLNDATISSFDQYKVFYHIFAGKDSGISYRVYLKNPPTSSYVSIPIEYTVPESSGYIAKGEYKTETKDFAAPSGYKELCVSINGEENCGFKQVSSSFAVNYVRDKYVQSEIEKTDISSERECISGGTNMGAILANTNPQSAVEESLLPENYKRGIVRICSTSNPGISTDPTRFQDVGYCNDIKVRCWLDKKSVDKSITAGNELVKNQTLTELERNQIAILQNESEILPEDTINAKIREFNGRIDKFSGVLDWGDVSALLNDVESVLMKTYFNKQKVQLLQIEAHALDKFARSQINKEKTGRTSTTISTTPTTKPAATPGATSNTATATVYTLQGTGAAKGLNTGVNDYTYILKNNAKITPEIYIHRGLSSFSPSEQVSVMIKESGNEKIIGIVDLSYKSTNYLGKIILNEDASHSIGEGDYNAIQNAFINTNVPAGSDFTLVKRQTGPSSTSISSAQTQNEFTLEGTERSYTPTESRINILYNGIKTGIYISNNKVYAANYVLGGAEQGSSLIGNIRHSSDGNDRIYLLPGKISEFYYNNINGTYIEKSGEENAERNLRLIK